MDQPSTRRSTQLCSIKMFISRISLQSLESVWSQDWPWTWRELASAAMHYWYWKFFPLKASCELPQVWPESRSVLQSEWQDMEGPASVQWSWYWQFELLNLFAWTQGDSIGPWWLSLLLARYLRDYMRFTHKQAMLVFKQSRKTAVKNAVDQALVDISEQIVKAYCDTCCVCSESNPQNKQPKKGAKKPIESSQYRDRFQGDLIDMRSNPGSHRCIWHHNEMDPCIEGSFG